MIYSCKKACLVRVLGVNNGCYWELDKPFLARKCNGIFFLWARPDYDIILSLCVIGAVVAAHAADAVAVAALLAVNGAVDNAADIVDVAVVASIAAVVAADTAEDIAAVAAAVLHQWRL